MANIKRIEGKKGAAYKITVSMGYGADGKQIRKYKTWRPAPDMAPSKAEKEAQRVAWQFEKDLAEGFHADDKQTVRGYGEHYMEMLRLKGDRPQTINKAQKEINRFCNVYGDMQIQKVKAFHIMQFTKECEKLGANKGNRSARPIADFENIKSLRNYKQFGEALGIDGRIAKKICLKQNISIANAEKVEKALHRKGLFEIVNNKERLAPSTINGQLTTLFSLFEQAKREHIIKYNPVAGVPRPKNKPVRTKEVIEPEDLKLILRCADMEPMDFKTMVYIMAYTGCRKGEMLALTWEDIDFNNKTMQINKGVVYTKQSGTYIEDTKTGEHRSVPLPPSLIKVLKGYDIYTKWSRLRQDGLLFHDSRGAIANPSRINYRLRQFTEKYQLRDLSPHTFRHSYASILLAEGVDVVTVAEILGHGVDVLLRTYTHAIKEKQREASDAMQRVINRNIVNI